MVTLMSRRRRSRLPSPEEGFRVDKDAPNLEGRGAFETKPGSSVEDVRRGNSTDKACVKYPDQVDSRQGKRLARELRRGGETGDFPDSPASSVRMGYYRYCLIGAVWKLFVEVLLISCPTTFTIIPRTWEFTPEELAGVDVRKLLVGFRTVLYAKGAAAAGGWLMVFLHGEFDPVAGVFRLHLHGLASKEMVAVLDRLRDYPRYQTRRLNDDGSFTAIYRPLVIRRMPLFNIPAPLTYLAQSFWPSRPIYISEAGPRRRVRDKQRIPEPPHTQALLWLAQWSVN